MNRMTRIGVWVFDRPWLGLIIFPAIMVPAALLVDRIDLPRDKQLWRISLLSDRGEPSQVWTNVTHVEWTRSGVQFRSQGKRVKIAGKYLAEAE